MRIILKIVAAPFMLALTLIVAVLSFSVSVASWVAGILSLVFAVGGLFELFIQSHTPWGITWPDIQSAVTAESFLSRSESGSHRAA